MRNQPRFMRRLLTLMVLMTVIGSTLIVSVSTTLAQSPDSPEGGEPDLAIAAQRLGITETELRETLGPPPPDLAKAAEALGITLEELETALGIGLEAPVEQAPSEIVTINGIDFEISYPVFTWDELPEDVIYERQAIQTFTNPANDTHYYEVIYVSSGNLNWYQAAYLAQDAGGYLASITSEDENTFVFELVSDEKYFWSFPEEGEHYGISIGPYLGGYQPDGSKEPDGGWQWLSGEDWDYTNWAQNLDDGVIDQDPRNNTQPNDSGDGQPIMGFGELNVPVPTWGDYMDSVASYGVERTPGTVYGFIIEYESMPQE